MKKFCSIFVNVFGIYFSNAHTYAHSPTPSPTSHSTHTHTYIHTHTHAPTHIHIHTHTHTHTHTYIHTHTHTHSVDIGVQLTNCSFEKTIILENKGERHQLLRWINRTNGEENQAKVNKKGTYLLHVLYVLRAVSHF